MPESTTSMNTPPKIYRFGLYGVSYVGKTCLLAALVMSRKSNPRDYTAVWQPCTMPQPKGKPQEWSADDPAAAAHRGQVSPTAEAVEANQDDDPAAAAHRGKKWLEDAVKSLKDGNVPKPNHATQELMTFDFDISTPEPKRTWHIELFDYSGELVNARDAADPESLAAKLQDHLKTMDGLLVLAAAPHADGSDSRSHEDLQILKQAFTALRAASAEGPVLTKPVALLINKWDRQSDDLTDYVKEQSRLRKFLDDDRHTVWKGVAQAIQNSVARDCFAEFPVSAFGKHERVPSKKNANEIIERPAERDVLPSFGIEDPFVWAVRTVDETDLARYEEQTSALRWYGLPWRPGRMAREGTRLMNRFAPEDDDRQRAEVARNRCRRIAGASWSLTVALVILVALGSEFGIDGSNYRWAMAALNDDKAATEQVEAAEEWFSDYSHSHGLRHLGLATFTISKDEAGKIIQEFHARQEAELWNLVENARTAGEKLATANKYLERFPEGDHANETRALIAEHKRLERVAENEVWLARQEADGDTLVQVGTTKATELKAALAELEHSPPHPQDVTEDQSRRRSELHNRLTKRLTEMLVEEDWEQFLAGYRDALKTRRFSQAANMLKTRNPVDENLRKLRGKFADDFPEALKRTVSELTEDRKWDDARNLLIDMDREHLQWPTEMQFDGAAELITEQQQRVADAHDKYLYDHFRRFRTEDAAQAYLALETDKPMEGEVQAYLNYLEARKQKHQFTIVLEKIEWADKYVDDTDHVVRFEVEDYIASVVKGVSSTAGGATGEIGRYELREEGTLDSTVKLKIKISNDDYFGNHLGKSTETVKLSDVDEYRQEIKVEGQGTCHACYRLEGGEIARYKPELPAWSPQ